MAQKTPNKESVPPTLPTHRAIELLQQQLDGVEQVTELRHDGPKVKAWELTTINVLHGAFGKPNYAYGGSIHMGLDT